MKQSSESRTILAIALPLTLAYVAEMGMVITDMVIVGRLGSVELAAVGLAGDLFWVFLLIGMGIVSIVGVFAAQALGANDLEAVRASGEQGMVAAPYYQCPDRSAYLVSRSDVELCRSGYPGDHAGV